MEINSLVPRRRTDKNGVTSIRWVRKDSGEKLGVSPALGNQPVVIAKSPEQIAEGLKNDVLAFYKREPNIESGADHKVSLSGIDFVLDAGYVNDAYKARDIGMLKSFLRNAASEDYSLDDVRKAYLMLRDNGYDEPDIYLSPEAVKGHRKLVKHLGVGSKLDPYSYVVESELPHDLLCYAITASKEDKVVIHKIIIERGITEVTGVRTMLAAMKGDGTALSDGQL